MQAIRIGRVALFLALTFALSWGFDLLIAVTIGQGAYLELGASPLGMFIPAFVALILRMFVFGDSRIHFRRYEDKSRWILYGYLGLTVVYGVVTVIGVTAHVRPSIFQGVCSLLMTLWTLLVIYVAGQSSKEQVERAGLQIGDAAQGVRLVVGVLVFFALQAGLNLILGLGRFQGPVERVYGVHVPSGLYPLALIVGLGLAMSGIPLSGLAAVFGEEYGWRGFLQDELSGLGTRRGALVVGLVWGLWHFPVILRGVHTYPPSALGLGLGLMFFVLWGLVQSYAVLKSRSIWVAAFLHGVVNSVYAFVLNYVVYPDDKVLSFGLGVYGLACLLVVVLLILRDPVWRTEPSREHV